MFDATTLNLIAPVKMVKNCHGGVYLTYSYNKSAKFRINMVPSMNTVLSGMFFDPTITNPLHKKASSNIKKVKV